MAIPVNIRRGFRGSPLKKTTLIANATAIVYHTEFAILAIQRNTKDNLRGLSLSNRTIAQFRQNQERLWKVLCIRHSLVCRTTP
jgi:hypothetical protein